MKEWLSEIRMRNLCCRGRLYLIIGRPRLSRLFHRAENDDIRLVRVFVPRLRGTIYDTYDEYLPSCVALLGNLKSQRRLVGLNLSSQRGPQGVCTGSGASDLPELVVLCLYK